MITETVTTFVRTSVAIVMTVGYGFNEICYMVHALLHSNTACKSFF